MNNITTRHKLPMYYKTISIAETPPSYSWKSAFCFDFLLVLRFFFPFNLFIFQRRQEVGIRDDHALCMCLRAALEPPKFMDLGMNIIPSEDTPA
jgi:hypothetical protein